MIWTIVILSKPIFGYFLIRLYKNFKASNNSLLEVKEIINSSHKQIKWLYIGLIGVALISASGYKLYDNWQERIETQKAELEELELMLEEEETETIEDEQKEEKEFICLDAELQFGSGSEIIMFYNKKDNNYDIVGEFDYDPFKGKVIFKDNSFSIISGNISGNIDLSSDCYSIRGMIKIKDEHGNWDNVMLNHKRVR